MCKNTRQLKEDYLQQKKNLNYRIRGIKARQTQEHHPAQVDGYLG